MSKALFRTAPGVRVPAVTADEMRAVDRVATDEVGVTLLQMMENAGRVLADHVHEMGGESAVVVAGNGGNGGGGLACARHLANHGVDVEVVLDRAPERLRDAAAHQYHTLEEMGLPTRVGGDALAASRDASVVVDSLVGYGLRGDVRAPARELIERMNRLRAPTVSLDVPSGTDATTGDARGATVDPDRVVTLALPKTGLVPYDGALFLGDIGVPRTVYDRLDIEYEPPFGSQQWVALRSETS
ncbi:NAD(P)H-hydrate epimerase [Halobellus sp. GM3]|uniref:NAD(P)H-hydrate epimerase n=1 Tax=Halobellus sp. GM3 TaxID=3458410 RepID=UPI00403E2785